MNNKKFEHFFVIIRFNFRKTGNDVQLSVLVFSKNVAADFSSLLFERNGKKRLFGAFFIKKSHIGKLLTKKLG